MPEIQIPVRLIKSAKNKAKVHVPATFRAQNSACLTKTGR
jgi:hypothetical protein